jgi:hypothetical protein
MDVHRPVAFAPRDVSYQAASKAVKEGRARRLGTALYTYDLETPAAELVSDHLYEILAGYCPAAVVTDRSAVVGGPVTTQDGTHVLFVAHEERTTEIQLPGHLIVPRRGSGPIEGDGAFMAEGVWLASRGRALVDNVRRSRTTRRLPPRTLSRAELESWVARLAGQLGDDGLRSLREEVERVAEELDEEEAGAIASSLLGAALGTQPGRGLTDDALRALRSGEGFDPERVELFEQLRDALERRAPRPLPVTPAGAARQTTLPFFEAYFSNFIEGTEFDVDEAADIIYEGRVPEQRPEDAHDVLGTFRIVSDPDEVRRIPRTPDEFVDLLRSRHATLMSGRRHLSPGRFKTRVNRVGSVVFVAPELVEGTLARGLKLLRTLDDPLARAVMMMFVVSEVHPFDDGNGRIARIMMNAELVSAAQHRVVIPIVYRNDYLMGLRGMSVNGNAEALIAVLAYAQRWVARMDWSTIGVARDLLERTNALVDPAQAEAEGLRLELPRDV